MFLRLVFLMVCTGLMALGASAQAIERGSVLVEFSGGPSSFGDQNRLQWEADWSSNYTLNWGIAPTGSITFMLGNHIGLGLNGEFHQVSASYVDWDGFDQRLYMRRYRISGHFEWDMITSDVIDFYWRTGGGVKFTEFFMANTGSPNAQNMFFTSDIFPFAFRSALGIRLWLEEVIGFTAELGLGGGANAKLGMAVNFQKLGQLQRSRHAPE